MEELCPEDRAILNSLFNPLLPLGEGVNDQNENESHLVAAGHDEDAVDADLHDLNNAGVQAAESGQLAEALVNLTQAINRAPHYAAAYNNRAQVYRLLRKEEEAAADLEKAISLTEGKGTVGVQALNQRGLLYKLTDDDDQARMCFKRAADQGSGFAKQQLITLNPMAALCNKMLVKMMADVKFGKLKNDDAS